MKEGTKKMYEVEGKVFLKKEDALDYEKKLEQLKYYLQEKYGKEFIPWYRDSFYLNWTGSEIQKEKFKEEESLFIGEDPLFENNITLAMIKEKK